MEKDKLVETNEANPRAIRKLEKDVFVIHNEDKKNQLKGIETQNNGNNCPEFENEQYDISDKTSYQVAEKLEGDSCSIQNNDNNEELEKVKTQNFGHDLQELDSKEDDILDKINKVIDINLSIHEEIKNNVMEESELAQRVASSYDLQNGCQQENIEAVNVQGDWSQKVQESDYIKSENQISIIGQEYVDVMVENNGNFEPKSQEGNPDNNFGHNDLAKEKDDNGSMESTQINQKINNISHEDNNLQLVFDEIHVVPGVEVSTHKSTHTLDANLETSSVVEKTISLKNFVREKSIVVISTMLRRLSRKRDENVVGNLDEVGQDVSNLSRDNETKEVSKKVMEKITWNSLNNIKMSPNVDVENKIEQKVESITEGPPMPIPMKGRIIVYTRLGCQECKEVRKFLYMKRLRYVEVNIDVYPSRKIELEKNSRSTSVPKIFFNEILIGGLRELKTSNESGKLEEKIDYIINEASPFEGPLPPLSGEDDVSSRGALDEMAIIVRKMKEYIVVKDRFYKMRRFASCFLGFEAVDFLSEDQYLERKEAIEFARKLASKLFFQHVLDENLFEDGNHLYRFLDDDPIVATECHNIPRGITTVKPKSVIEVASRLRLLSYAMFEAYASEDGRHVDYRSMHGSEEFARYLRTVEELQRGEIWNLSREEKLSFFINLYNMMTIHAILVWGHPTGALERRKLFGDFKYVIGGSTYSLLAIQNGILRGNQRPPYTLMKLFGVNDKRLKVALPFPEPLIHFALVYGTRSGPALRCYSPGDIDKELVDAARDFLRNGGLLIDFDAKVAYASKILKW